MASEHGGCASGRRALIGSGGRSNSVSSPYSGAAAFPHPFVLSLSKHERNAAVSLRLLAEVGGPRNSRTPSFLAHAVYAYRLCLWRQ
jgi:hypothetical protein